MVCFIDVLGACYPKLFSIEKWYLKYLEYNTLKTSPYLLYFVKMPHIYLCSFFGSVFLEVLFLEVIWVLPAPWSRCCVPWTRRSTMIIGGFKKAANLRGKKSNVNWKA